MKKHLKIKFSSFDTFCLILKIKQMDPLGFVNMTKKSRQKFKYLEKEKSF